MSREPKPYFKKQQQRWVCTIDGKRITLGADKKTMARLITGVRQA